MYHIYFIAELDYTEKQGVARRFDTEESAQIWATLELQANPNCEGPCHIFKLSPRSEKTELMCVMRREGERIQTIAIKKSQREDFLDDRRRFLC